MVLWSSDWGFLAEWYLVVCTMCCQGHWCPKISTLNCFLILVIEPRRDLSWWYARSYVMIEWKRVCDRKTRKGTKYGLASRQERVSSFSAPRRHEVVAHCWVQIPLCNNAADGLRPRWILARTRNIPSYGVWIWSCDLGVDCWDTKLSSSADLYHPVQGALVV